MAREHTLTEILVAGGLTAIGLATGQSVLLSLVADVGGNWVANLAQSSLGHWQKSWFTESGALNGDVARLLSRALDGAIRQIERDWMQHKLYRHLARIDPEQAKLSLEALRAMREDATRLFAHPYQYQAIVQTEGVPLLLRGAETSLQGLIADTLSAYLYGYDGEFVTFVQDRLADQWLLRFGEELKDPGEEGTRAWRALQRLWQESLTFGLKELKQTTEETLAIARWLQDWAGRLDHLPENERENTGLDELEAAIAPVRLHLEEIKNVAVRLEAGQTRIEEGQDRIEGGTRRIGVGLEELLARVQPTQARRTGAEGDANLAVECPYPGMVPFRAENSHLFYGRDTEVQGMVKHLRHRPFLLVIGASASGKSSLLSAGLLPALEQTSLWSQGFWRVLSMRPGTEPMVTLCQLLEKDVIDDISAAIAEHLDNHQPSKRLLIIIDQLEELFTQAEHTERRQFISLLKEMIKNDSCALVLALRADFYHDLMASDLWPVAPSDRVEIAPLRGDGLRAAILRPATDVGVYVEGGLLERLLNDASDEPGSLPLLQETLVLLWEQREGRMLTLDAYERLGGKKRSGLAVAVADKADAVFASLTPEQQVISRRVFLRLIQFGEGRPDTRRQQETEELHVAGEDASLLESTLTILAGHRLLVMGESKESHATSIDLAHEILIREWPTLQNWVTERREAEQMRRRLEEKATEWVRLGKGESGLLDEGELSEAERWLASVEANDLGCTETLLLLVEASQEQIAQAQRKEREAEERSRAARRLRRVAAALVALVLLVGTIATLAILSWREADVQRGVAQREAEAKTTAQVQTEHLSRIVRAQGIAAQALAQIQTDPELGTLLAMEAISLSLLLDEPVASQAEDALHQALARSHIHLALRGFKAPVLSAIYSQDGRNIVTVSGGLAEVWDAATGMHEFTLPAITRTVTLDKQPSQIVTDTVRSAIYSPDGQFIATAMWDYAAVWSVSRKVRVMEMGRSDTYIRTIVYSPDGRTLAVGRSDGSIQLWETTTGALVHTLRVPVDVDSNIDIKTIEFSPDGQQIICATEIREVGYIDQVGQVFIWEVASRQLVRELYQKGADPSKDPPVNMQSAIYSPDGKTIVTLEYDVLKIWDAPTGNFRKSWPVKAWSGTYGSQGLILLYTWEGEATLWDEETGIQLLALGGSTSTIGSAAWSPDEHYIMTTGEDILGPAVRIWDVASSGESRTPFDIENIAGNIAYSPDGLYIVGGSGNAGEDYTIKVWKADSGEEHLTLCCHANLVTAANFSRDGDYIVTSSEDGTAKVWDARVGVEKLTLRGHHLQVNSATFSPDGRYVVTASADGLIFIWDATSGDNVLQLGSSEQRPDTPLSKWSAEYSPDGQLILTTGADGAEMWDAHTGNSILWLPEANCCASFSHDGKYILTDAPIVGGSSLRVENTAAKVWDAHSGAVILTLKGHQGSLSNAAFSPDGRFIATASFDGTTKLWDASTGENLLTLSTPLIREKAIAQFQGRLVPRHVTFNPNNRVLTVLRGGIVQQYLLDAKELLEFAATHVTRSLTERERVIYLGETITTEGPISNITLEGLLARAEKLMKRQEYKGVLEVYQEAERLYFEIPYGAELWNSLCWEGTLWGEASSVMSACERAVALAPEDGNARDSRGLARALTGDIAGAINDFKYYILWARGSNGFGNVAVSVPRREAWIKDLERGLNPITADVLQAERDEELPSNRAIIPTYTPYPDTP
jgi:WD40 repeat protein